MDCCGKNETNSEKTTMRSREEIQSIKSRLNRIEGQVRGISKMLDENRYCGDILIQLSAIDKAIKSVSNDILKRHLETCVVRDIKEDKLEVLDEVIDLCKRFQ
ncbi:MAG: metal-sensing transcriptional repressor [Coprobacillus sp.]|nr:metal-sensing transcriptional repressor [Coprobacillus sp.]